MSSAARWTERCKDPFRYMARVWALLEALSHRLWVCVAGCPFLAVGGSKIGDNTTVEMPKLSSWRLGGFTVPRRRLMVRNNVKVDVVVKTCYKLDHGLKILPAGRQ
jgi:hypothetical protein